MKYALIKWGTEILYRVYPHFDHKRYGLILDTKDMEIIKERRELLYLR